MWRRIILKVTPTRKAVARTFVEESENKSKTSKTDMNESELNRSEKLHESDDPKEKFIENASKGIVESVKLFAVFQNMSEALIKEHDRLSKEEHIILFGKAGYGNSLMHDVLLGYDTSKTSSISDNSSTYIPTGKQISDTESIASSLKFKETEIYHNIHGRQVKITSLNVEDKASLSSLAISEEYSVVFCFPVSFRFTSEDLELLEKYMQYRQREDFKRVIVAFTFSDRKQVSDRDYINHLPKKMKDFLKTYGNDYVFINSADGDSIENQKSVKHLLKLSQSDEFTKTFKHLVFMYLGVNIFRFAGIPYV